MRSLNKLELCPYLTLRSWKMAPCCPDHWQFLSQPMSGSQTYIKLPKCTCQVVWEGIQSWAKPHTIPELKKESSWAGKARNSQNLTTSFTGHTTTLWGRALCIPPLRSVMIPQVIFALKANRWTYGTGEGKQKRFLPGLVSRWPTVHQWVYLGNVLLRWGALVVGESAA